MRFYYLLALLMLISASARGARPEPVVVHTDLSNVKACLPLAGGEVLLGTDGGLALLDARLGLKRRWTRLDGLPGTRVHALHEEAGRVWVGTEGGLALVALQAASPGARAKPALAWAIPSPPVRAIARHAGRLYVGTWGRGVLRLDARARKLSPLGGKRRHRVAALASVGGTLFIGTAGAGLWQLRGGRVQAVPARLPGEMVWTLRVGPAGRLLVGTLLGLFSIDPSGANGPAARELSSDDTRALLVEGDGAILLGSYGQGLRRLPVRGRGRRLGHVNAAFVNDIREKGGVTCVAARDGLRLWAKHAGPARTRARHVRPAGPPSNDISALALSGDRLMVGTFDGGLAELTPKGFREVEGVDARIDAIAVEPGRSNILRSALANRAPVHAHHLPSRAPRTASRWVGTPRGLYRLGGDGSVRRFGVADGLRHPHIHSLAVLRRGGVVAGTGRGAVLVRDGVVTPINVKHGLAVASIWAVVEDEGGDLWLGTSKGLYHWSLAARRYRRYSVASGHLSDDWVTALVLHRGVLYVGTYNAGVCRLERSSDGEWTGTGLGGGWINFGGLVVYRGVLLASTMGGLRAMPLARPRPGSFRLVEGAAPGRDVTAALPSPAGLWVASRRGLVRWRGLPGLATPAP